MPETMDRTKFIGASEIGSIMGVNPWCTPLKLWAIKTKKIENDLSEFEAAEWGVRLEEVISKKFSQKNNCKLMAYKKRFVHPDLPYLSCELDRVIVGTDKLVEIKTCNAWQAKKWEGEDIPASYVLQVNAQLGLSGRKKGHLAVLIGGNKYLEKEIEFDQDLFDKEVAAAKNFWENFVLTDIAPMACSEDNELLGSLYPTSQEKTVDLSSVSEQVNSWIDERASAIAVKKEAEEACKTVEAKLKQLMGEAEFGETDQYKISWKTQSRAEYIVKSASFRVLRTQLKKQEITK